jgi:hypothetical protein
MLRFDATPPLVDARAAADAYAPEPSLRGLAAPLSPAAVAAIRHAQVEIYCDHDRQALADIHAARNSLLTMPSSVPSDAFAELDQAVWRMRHHDYRAAEQALERALVHLHSGASS